LGLGIYQGEYPHSKRVTLATHVLPKNDFELMIIFTQFCLKNIILPSITYVVSPETLDENIWFRLFLTGITYTQAVKTKFIPNKFDK